MPYVRDSAVHGLLIESPREMKYINNSQAKKRRYNYAFEKTK